MWTQVMTAYRRAVAAAYTQVIENWMAVKVAAFDAIPAAERNGGGRPATDAGVDQALALVRRIATRLVLAELNRGYDSGGESTSDDSANSGIDSSRSGGRGNERSR